ncbi:ABC transporter permease [Tessaracoccus sp. MC1865]|uniref:ABC transporter permease n=1 Tax=unclassified Tessaracoccus TaxID=2635419 RepID=UPI0015FFA8D2|nr:MULTISPECIES: ABC transporter permease [unclassified Tessaracoccus]MBB1484562.1 ABC transporter permease [Tessaracoccus sp. MC1865]MBB1509439.1 ABC transporter permease [Tessaracoccus sp. MC1756]QTO38346.1 ABC transporter permease [Tessaracoccus sp. MC1865]
MSTQTLPIPDSDLRLVKKVESPEAKAQRLSTGTLIAVMGVALLVMAFTVNKSGRIALSDAFSEVQLPTLELPGTATVLIAALLVLGAGIGYLTGKLSGRMRTLAAVVAGLGIVVGFLVWAAASSPLPFTLTSQLNLTLEYATPLFFGVLGGVLAERAGVVNIAIEGMFLTAAFSASLTYSMTQSFVAALFAAALAGVMMAGILALFTLRYLVDHVIIGVVINVLATGLTGFIYQQLVAKDIATYSNVRPMLPIRIPGLADVPFLGPILFTQRPLTYIAFVAVPLVWFLLFRTKWGLRVRSVGEHPHAADTVGINVLWTKASAVLLGGVFAGIGGAYFTIGSVGSFQDNNPTAGNGFIALAAVIMGRWHPVLGAFVALFFGFARALAQNTKLMQLPIPSDFIEMLPYLATIIAVAGLVGRVRAPAADGAHFIKSH